MILNDRSACHDYSLSIFIPNTVVQTCKKNLNATKKTQIGVFNAMDSLLATGLTRPTVLPWSKHTNTSHFKNMIVGMTFSQFVTATTDARLYHTEVAGRDVMLPYGQVEAEDTTRASSRVTCSSCRCSSITQTHRLLDTVRRKVFLVHCCFRHAIAPHRLEMPLVTMADYWRALQPVV